MHSINYFVSRETQLKFQVLFVKTGKAAATRIYTSLGLLGAK